MKKYYYLVSIQFLGFRYSGWQKQVNGKTVQGMIDKTFKCIFNHENFKTLGAGRTDSKVSANQFFFELFIFDKQNESELLIALNNNLPADIRALNVVKVSKDFNVITDVKLKEYTYLFTNDDQMHPYCASLMVSFPGELDIDLMKIGAKLFEGNHDFQRYCYKPNDNTVFERFITLSEIVDNDLYTGNFFPNQSWIYKIQGSGFLRHQVRIIVGTLIKLGRHEITLDDIKKSLLGGSNERLSEIAPSSGLSLNSIHY